jgi:Flp pilus assembly protein TadG
MKLRPIQRGAFTAPFAIMLVPLLGMVGMALDLSFAYVRRTEMQGLADVAALAAARALDGTMSGVTTARLQARQVAEGTEYSFRTKVVWNESALRFAAAPAAG